MLCPASDRSISLPASAIWRPRFEPFGVAESGAPRDVVWLLDYLFSTVMDGRNAHLTDGVQRALGHPPKDFAEFAREIAAGGAWRAAA